jgi:hypothetical protein
VATQWVPSVTGVSNYLIRVQLPDRPGALGAVASRIGSVGGDVVSIDILQRQDGVVVDEIGVGLPSHDLVDLVRDEILEVDGVSIESVLSIEGPLPDRQRDLLAVTDELFEQESADKILDHLVSWVRRSLAATFAVVVDADARVVACDGPIPEGFSGTGGGGESPTLAAAPLPSAALVLVMGRGEPELRQRERRWVTTLAGLADRSLRVLGSSDRR